MAGHTNLEATQKNAKESHDSPMVSETHTCHDRAHLTMMNGNQVRGVKRTSSQFYRISTRAYPGKNNNKGIK